MSMDDTSISGSICIESDKLDSPSNAILIISFVCCNEDFPFGGEVSFGFMLVHAWLMEIPLEAGWVEIADYSLQQACVLVQL